MVKYKEKIFKIYEGVKNLKYAKEVFGGFLIAGGIFAETYFYRGGEDKLGIVTSFPLFLFGFYSLVNGLADKWKIFEINKNNLERKILG